MEQRTAVIGTVNAYLFTAGDVQYYWERSGIRGREQIYVNFELDLVDMFINIIFEEGDGQRSNWRSGEAYSH